MFDVYQVWNNMWVNDDRTYIIGEQIPLTFYENTDMTWQHVMYVYKYFDMCRLQSDHMKNSKATRTTQMRFKKKYIYNFNIHQMVLPMSWYFLYWESLSTMYKQCFCRYYEGTF